MTDGASAGSLDVIFPVIMSFKVLGGIRRVFRCRPRGLFRGRKSAMPRSGEPGTPEEYLGASCAYKRGLFHWSV